MRNKDVVLVTNYRCVRGLEFSHVLLLLNENQYYIKQFIPEAIARSMSNLTILLLPYQKRFIEDGTVSDLVQEWRRNNTDTEGPILEIVKIDWCYEEICRIRNQSGYCKEGSSIFVQHCGKLYENLYEEIKDHAVPKFQSDNQKMNKEALIL